MLRGNLPLAALVGTGRFFGDEMPGSILSPNLGLKTIGSCGWKRDVEPAILDDPLRIDQQPWLRVARRSLPIGGGVAVIREPRRMVRRARTRIGRVVRSELLFDGCVGRLREGAIGPRLSER